MLLLQFLNIDKPPAKITGGTLSLGHDKSNDIVIDEPGVSDFHAELSIEENRITLSDLLSKNGTYVNGSRISRNKELQPWDRIKLASVEIEISEPEKYRPGDWALKKESDLLNSQHVPLQEETTVGRSPDCDLVILDGLLSRKHAVLTIEGDQLRVLDLDSANGTFINQQKVKSALARPGDEIMFDKISFELLGPSSAELTVEPEESTVFRDDEQDITQLHSTTHSEFSQIPPTSKPNIEGNDKTILDDHTSLLEPSDIDQTQLFETDDNSLAEQTVLMAAPSDSNKGNQEDKDDKDDKGDVDKTVLYSQPEETSEYTIKGSTEEHAHNLPPWAWLTIGFLSSLLLGILVYAFLK